MYNLEVICVALHAVIFNDSSCSSSYKFSFLTHLEPDVLNQIPFLIITRERLIPDRQK